MRSVKNAAGRVASGFAIVLVGVALVAAACGGGSSGGTSSGGSSGGSSASSSGSGASSTAGSGQVSLSEFKITPATITASVGSTLTVQNTGTVAHDLVIQSPSGATVARTSVIQPGASAQLQLPSSAAAGLMVSSSAVPRAGSGSIPDRLSVGALGLGLVLLVSAAWGTGIFYLVARIGLPSPVRLAWIDAIHVYVGLMGAVFILGKVIR